MSGSIKTFAQLPAQVREAIAAGEGYAYCPSCDGGSSRRKTLGLIRGEAGAVILKCFRLTCGYRGTTLPDGTAVIPTPQERKGRFYRDATVPVGGDAQAVVELDYCLDRQAYEQHGWRMNETGRELVMPVLDPYGRVRGHTTRTLFDKRKRCFTYNQIPGAPFLDWWLGGTQTIVVVEGQLDAARLSGLGYNAVALLGTAISPDDAIEISQTARQAGATRLVLGLDRDAFAKALKLRRKLAHILPLSDVLCLERDFKDTHDDNEIRGILDGQQQLTGGGAK